MRYLARPILVVIIVAIFSACDGKEQPKDVATFMVLESCKQQAVDFFENLDPAVRIDYQYTEFDFDFESHPDVAGYMMISSDLDREKGLENYISSVRSKCYPNARKTVSRNDPDYPDKVFEFIENRESLGVGRHYVNIGSDEVVVMWRSANQ